MASRQLIVDSEIVTSASSRTRFRRLLLPLLAVLSVAAIACGSDGFELPGLGDKSILPIGASMEIDTGEGRALIQFLSVGADSRCPSGAQCIVAGDATITLALTLEDGARRAFPVTVPPGGSVRSEVAGYVLTLTDLFPDPPPERMSDSLYRASLILTRP